MENEKKYEGTVNITSAEYRELVTDAVKAKAELSEVRSAKWKVESEREKLKTECDELRMRLNEAEKHLAAYKHSYATLSHLPVPSEGFKVNPCATTTYNGGSING